MGLAFSFKVIKLGPIEVVACISFCSFFIANWYSVISMNYNFLTICLLDIWIVSSSGLLWVKLLWTFMVFCMKISFCFSRIKTQVCNLWVVWQSHIYFYKTLPTCFLWWLYHCTFPPVMFGWSSFSASLSMLGISLFLFQPFC